MVDPMTERSGKEREDLRLFGARNSKIKECFPCGILIMRIYFLIVCLGFPVCLFILFIIIFRQRIELFFFVVYSVYGLYAVAIYGMYRVTVYGFAVMPILGALTFTLVATQIPEVRIWPIYFLLWPSVAFGFLLGLWATWVACKIRRRERLNFRD